MKIKRYKDALIHRSIRLINERRGWATDRKIIVIESDDWGGIRMPDRKTYDLALESGIKVNNCAYCKNDTLASCEDLQALFDILSKHKDSKGNFPVITANTIVANPDFEKIRKSNFKEYHFELFTETLKRYPQRDFEIWKEGIKEKVFFPQLHGREHLNIGRWLQGLQNGSKEMHFAFNHNFFGISKSISNENNPSLMAALDYDDEYGEKLAKNSVREAQVIFKSIFGYSSKSFIGPNYYWDSEIEKILSENDVDYLQGSFINKSANEGNRNVYIGKKNRYGQIYTARNVNFEPAFEKKPSIEKALRQIEKAFSMKKPAIISAHRVNFIGSVFEENRTKNLDLLNDLLGKIIARWPNIEFMNSAQLGDLIKK